MMLFILKLSSGVGPYARSDVDIIVVAQTLDEAAEIVEKVIDKVRLAYGDVVIFETPCSAPQLQIQYGLFSRFYFLGMLFSFLFLRGPDHWRLS